MSLKRLRKRSPKLSSMSTAIDDCRHFLMEECPDEFVRAATAFCAPRR